jgi:hypothetical protein
MAASVGAETGGLGSQSADRLSRGLLLAPPIFVAHFLEESRGFVPWFNAHVTPGITDGLLWTVNFTGLVILVIVVAAHRTAGSPVTLLAAVAWISFLLLANGVFHVVGAVVDRRYVPGVVTAGALYLPYCGWLAREVLRRRDVSHGLAALAAVLGALPMAIHGYLILFCGSRLF